MIVVGHDSGDVETYTLRVDEEGLGAAAGNVFFCFCKLTEKERERAYNYLMSIL